MTPKKIHKKFKQKNYKRFIMQIFYTLIRELRVLTYIEYSRIYKVVDRSSYLRKVPPTNGPKMVHRLFLFCPVIQARRSIYGASGVLSPHCYTEQGRKVVVVIVLGRSDYSLISMRPTYHFDT